MKMIQHKMLRSWLSAGLCACYLAAPVAWSAELDISSTPLFLGGAIEPNIMFNLDDSGSMYWSFMPDTVYSERGDERGLAANYNKLAYDPTVTYSPPVNSSGTALSNASFTAAWVDGYAHDRGATTCTVNLSTSYRPTWYYGNNCNTDIDYTYEYWSNTAAAAYYYVYYLNRPDGTTTVPSGCTAGNENDDDCYIKVTVSDDSGVDGADERQNFANWYSYYRTRMFAARAGVGRAFSQLGTGVRIGFAAINKGSSSIDDVNARAVISGVRSFTGDDRTAFFSNLYSRDPTGSTPLRRAADAVGKYFKRTDNKGPWNETPGSSGGRDLSCRPNYHIIMSDGYWTDGDSYDADTAAARENVDHTAGPSHTSVSGDTYTYTVESPFDDAYDDTLADIAMYYWKSDLRTDLDNDVATNGDDPAFWQHLVTFAVGLGVSGSIDPDSAFAAIGKSDTTTITWPDPNGSSKTSEKIDDMLHAAVNGRGGFYSASNPTDFAEALGKTLDTIISRKSSAASVVLNSNTLFEGSRLYQAIFNSENWSGELQAYTLAVEDAEPTLDTSFSTAAGIPSPDLRRILTYNGSGGIPFRWASLTDAQKLIVDPSASVSDPGNDILNYIRGDRSNESETGLRVRTSLLGDIVNATPAFVNPPNAPYFDYWGDGAPENTVSYTAFRADHASRTPFLAVGANDGMLHIFDAEDGSELMAYVPTAVFGNLADLADQDYDHKYYVDSGPTVVDAFYGSAWHTVLAGGLGAGGQAVYALDVTNMPDDADTESAVSTKVLWEFTDANDADLGYTYSRPNIVRLANGVWAAIFGNGYGNTEPDGTASSTGNAVLYVVNIQTGALIKKIDTGVGSEDDPLALNRPNGLATVAPVDVDGDFIVDYVYGGDLFGNMWKFDLSDSSAVHWGVAYKAGAVPQPLFQARFNPADAATAQPITVRPQVARHPQGEPGQLVLFGTGKYFEIGDNTDVGQTTQSFYAVWDRNETNLTGFTRDDLLEQKITYELTSGGQEYRISTNEPLNWHEDTGLPDTGEYLGWYMDLYNQESGGTANYGERMVSDPIVRGDRIIFATLIPSADACDYGGDGWLMELDYGTGSRLDETPFDVNGDGEFSVDDLVDPDGDGGSEEKSTVSGRKSNVGIIPAPAILSRGGTTTGLDGGGGQIEYKYESGSSGAIEKVDENPGDGEFGRQSWRQLPK